MAALHFEFVVDSDVYPELHAALASIGSPESRGERIRQLAATGLLWEAARIHGASVTAIAGPSSPPYPELQLAKGSVRNRARIAARSADRRSPTTPSPGELTGPANGAIPAEAPSAVDAPAPPLHDRRLDAPSAAQIPVLIDVVRFTPPSAPSGAPGRATQPGVPADARAWPSAQAAEALPAPSDARTIDDNVDDSPGEPADDHAVVLAPVATLIQRPAARSRLLRMKEMGLFKNG
jgi:hypothetical protein